MPGLHEIDYPVDFLIAFLHPVGGTRRPVVVERGGIHGLEVDLVRRHEQMRQRELVIDLVKCVGVEDDSSAWCGGFHND